jgi:lipopolysaccharide heptosyltransferase II
MALPAPIDPAPRPDPAERWPEQSRRQLSLVVQTSFLGDVVLTTPLLAELATRGPVIAVTTRQAAPLLANHPAVATLVVYDKRKADAGVRGLFRVARRVRHAVALAEHSARPSHVRRVAYFAQGSVRSASLGMLAGFGERVGFATSPGRVLYTMAVPFRDDRHHAERLWSLAHASDGDLRPSASLLRPRLYPGREERGAVDALLRDAGAEDDALVALAPGSVWATKRWPFYAELAGLLGTDTRIVVIGSGDDRELAAAIVAATGGRAIDATGRLSLLASAELIGRCKALVTNDSAPQHLASAMNTPTVTVFGPTVPDFGFGPLASGSSAIGVDALACRPCDRHGPKRCPLGHWRCMRDLGVERVAERVRQIAGAPTAPIPLTR